MVPYLRQIGRWVAEFELLLVLLLLPIFILSDRHLWLGVLLWLTLVALRWFGTGQALWTSPATVILAVFVCLVPVTLSVTPLPDLTRNALGYLMAGLVLFLAVINWVDTTEHLWWLLTGVMLCLIALALVTPLLEPTLVRHMPDGVRRVAGVIPEQVNPNVISGTLVIWLPVAAVLAWHPIGRALRQRRILRILAFTGVALSLTGLLLLNSRGAWLAGIVGVALAITLKWPQMRRLTPLILVLVWLVAAQGALARLAGLMFPSDTFAGLEARREIWSHAYGAIQDFALTGMGMGTWSRLGPLLYPYLSIKPTQVIPHAHNLLLQVGVDLGVMGLVAYVALVGLSLGLTARAYRRLNDGAHVGLAALGLGITAGLFAMLVHGMFDAVTWGTKPAVFAWVLMAVAIVLFRFAESTKLEAEH